jgi:gamma-glutamyl:cysteine ligase YbdK (ATP-grasp superfamily)
MAAITLIWCMILAVSLAPFPQAVLSATDANPSERAAELVRLRRKYDEARDPVHRAKALAQLGEAQVKDAGARMSAHDYAGAVAELRQYSEEVAAARKDLAASHVDPERKPGGFRELQLSVRENLQRIEDIAFAASASQQNPLVEIHEQLGQENQKLLTELFPTAATGSMTTRPRHP